MANSENWSVSKAHTTCYKGLSGLLLLLCALIGLACTAKPKSNNQTDNKPRELLLLFQKTPCYGSCPAYNASFYSDGSIRYEGFRHVPVQDTLWLQLSKEQLSLVKESLESIDYPSLESTYNSPYTDLPSTYLTFYQEGKEMKCIKHQQNGPEKLRKLIENLDELVMELVQKDQ